MGNENTVDILIKARGDMAAVQQGMAQLDQLKQKAEGLFETLREGIAVGAGIKISESLAELPNVIYEITTSGEEMAGKLESMQVAFETLLGSSAEAKARMAELRKFAADTPFEIPEVVQASRTLELMTKGALSTGAGLRMVGDAASAAQMPFSEMAMWVGRMYDGLMSGRPVGEALMRLQEMAVISGDVRGKIEALQKSGASGAEVWAVAEAAFGKFTGAMERGSKTLEGVKSNLNDAWEQAKTAAMQDFAEHSKIPTAKLAESLQTQEVQDGLKLLIADLLRTKEALVDVQLWAARHAEGLGILARAAGIAGAAITTAFAAQKLSTLVAWLGSVTAETAAVNANSASWLRNAAARTASAGKAAMGMMGGPVAGGLMLATGTTLAGLDWYEGKVEAAIRKTDNLVEMQQRVHELAFSTPSTEKERDGLIQRLTELGKNPAVSGLANTGIQRIRNITGLEMADEQLARDRDGIDKARTDYQKGVPEREATKRLERLQRSAEKSGSTAGLDTEMARVQARINALNATPADKQRTKDFEALAGLEKEKDALESVIEAVKTATAEKARLAELNRQAKLSEIELAEAMAAGDSKRVGQIQWTKDRNEAHQAGLKDDEAVRYANAKAGERDKDIAAQKEALALEIQLSEAKAVGNEPERRRLEWIKEYKRVLDATQALGVGLTDADAAAKRSANAKDTGEPTKESAILGKATAWSGAYDNMRLSALAGTSAQQGEPQVRAIQAQQAALLTKLDSVESTIRKAGGRF